MTTEVSAGDSIAAMAPRLRAPAQAWLRPAAYAAFVELITVAGTLLGPPARPYHRAVDWIAVLLVLVAAGTVAFARSWPLPAFAVALATTGAYYGLGYHTDSSYFVGVLVTGYLSSEAGHRLRAGLLAGATVALLGLLGPYGRSAEPYGGLVTAGIAVGGIVAGQVAAELRAAFTRRARVADENKTRQLVAEERLRIARELHDVVSHSIAMINVQAAAALHVMGERPEQAREALNNIKSASHNALRDMRAILGLLRDTEADEPRAPTGSVDRLPSLIENVRRSGTQVSLTTDGVGGPLPPAIDLAAYRVVQEALTNVVRHAPGAPARVKLTRLAGQIEVLIENDGTREKPGPESRQGAGHGLAGMRERVEAARGTLVTGPRPEGGFAVRAVLPIS